MVEKSDCVFIHESEKPDHYSILRDQFDINGKNSFLV